MQMPYVEFDCIRSSKRWFLSRCLLRHGVSKMATPLSVAKIQIGGGGGAAATNGPCKLFLYFILCVVLVYYEMKILAK